MVTQALVGDRVRRLRLSLGLGQSDLAQRTGLASGSVSMLENGRYPVDDRLLASIAGVLDSQPTYFTALGTEPLVTRPWLRAYADAPRRVVDREVADATTAAEAFECGGLQLVPDSLPIFSGDLNNDDEIEQFAGDVRAAAGLGVDDVVSNAMRLVERLGCVVLPMEAELGRHLGLSLRVDGTPLMKVSRPSEDPEHPVPGDRQRFTVAHELGHLTLHHATPPPDSATDASRIERQAHRFAAALLTPGDALSADLEGLGGRVTLSSLAALKGTWGVAIKALVLRFQQLGVIDDDHARSLYKQISARRWNKAEPVPVGNESAVWLEKALKKRWAGEADASGAAASAAGIGRAYFERWIDWRPTPLPAETARVVTVRPKQAGPVANRDTDAVVRHLPVRRPSDRGAR